MGEDWSEPICSKGFLKNGEHCQVQTQAMIDCPSCLSGRIPIFFLRHASNLVDSLMMGLFGRKRQKESSLARGRSEAKRGWKAPSPKPNLGSDALDLRFRRDEQVVCLLGRCDMGIAQSSQPVSRLLCQASTHERALSLMQATASHPMVMPDGEDGKQVS